MKINKWTLGLAAVGLVSLASVARAEEAKTVPLLTALSATTISGYVDVSAVWNPGSGNANPAPYSFNAGKQDGFNVDLVDIALSKPLEEGQWSSGYKLELMAGPDAPGISPDAAGNAAAIRQAYVNLRAPVGNGLDFQIGRFDNILGYEATDSYKNPNWTRSYGYTLEPTEHTGVLGSYKFSDMVSATVGVANTVTTGGLNARNASGGNPAVFGGKSTIESKKSILSLVTLTAPESWGWVAGSALYGGVDYGSGNGAVLVNAGVPIAKTVDKTHVYVGLTMKTPLKDLTVGASYDSVNNSDSFGALPGNPAAYAMAVAGYASYKITDKASVHTRIEYAHASVYPGVLSGTRLNGGQIKALALTGTFQYDLWQNVISRLEVRWDHAGQGRGFQYYGGTAAGVPARLNEVTVAANIVYKF